MPAEGIHLTSLREAIASPRFPAGARACTTRQEDAARLGAIAHDLPYFDRYLAEVVRYATKRTPRPSAFGSVVHERAAVDIALFVLERARSLRSERLAAVGLGLVSHAAMDRQLHPLVNALARRYAEGRTHDASHREVEKHQSIGFHDAYFGSSIMGNPRVVRLVSVPIAELFGDRVVVSTLATAFSSACGIPMSPALLARMGRGYAQHAVLLGTPLGKRAAPAHERASIMPRFLSGTWGRFEAILSQAIQGSLVPLERAWALYEASERDETRARAALLDVLPLGSIDPQGEDVDLERPYVVRA
ncbi:MAG: hypothetical protein JST00_15060 [Deltaproteobacteria bacterium]|nr:hypothetical protein [Deltaproteobacteria bacterium]